MEQRDEQSEFTPRFKFVSGERETPLTEDGSGQRSEPSVLRAAASNVVSIEDYRDPARASAAPGRITSLYRDRVQSNPHLARALNLLEDGHRALTRALQSFAEGDGIAADDAVQAMQATLPELFLCRDLGEGYAAMIAGLHFAFENRRGEALDHSQIQTLERVVRELQASPFMPVTSAYEALAHLEEAGFIVTPKSLSCLFGEAPIA